MALPEGELITRKTILQLEMGAIERAAAELDESIQDFYCVGHSVLGYYLDDYRISTLLDHRGGRIKVEIIATFLPREVVESLYAVVEKIGSTVESMTLEPIAAMNAIIPRELQMLNLALVDIGAGTSDIAVTDKGSVVAYTMATIAGDEVTEAIISTCLVDFETAEGIKAAISAGDAAISYTDILGVENTMTAQEALEMIQPATAELSAVISERILEINSKAPRAVFLVGGGSKAPGLREAIAGDLGMDISKVAVGGNNYMKKTCVSEMDLSAPEFATPVGIAVTAAAQRDENAGKLSINGKMVRIPGDAKAQLVDVLLRNGYSYSEIIGRTGRRVVCTVDGKRVFFNGGCPVSAKVCVNGRQAELGDVVHEGDAVEIEPATSGADAAPCVQEAVAGLRDITVTLDGRPVRAGILAWRSGAPAAMEDVVRDGDVIETVRLDTAGALLEHLQAGEAAGYTRNGQPCSAGDRLQDGDVLERIPVSEPEPETWRMARRGSVELILNGNPLRLEGKAGRYQFMDVLAHMNIDPQQVKNSIRMQLNGREASFLDILENGDVVDVQWD